MVDFPTSYENASALLLQLKDNNWIDIATRAVMIDFTLYNPNVHLIVAVELVVERYATGLLQTIASIKPMSLLVFEFTQQKAELAGEIILVAWVGFYIFREVRGGEYTNGLASR